MRVVLIASTDVNYDFVARYTPYEPHVEVEADGLPTPADELAELAGRNCYRSWSRPNPKTATNAGYLARILSQGHDSVLEHASATFYVEGVSRALLAELTRHRHLSFSVVSQRYVDANTLDVVYPPILDEVEDEIPRQAMKAAIAQQNQGALAEYDKLVDELVARGYKRKQAREAARAVLPSSMESPMVVSGNLRAWRDVLGKRHHVAADKELQAFAAEVLRWLRAVAPNSFQDIPDEPFGS